MNNELHGRKFPVCEKVYGFLLSAYPPTHRAAYGAAMAQLFRDQCRDAWDESKNFGLLKLWLRVLPDLARTSIMERLTALNERKTMSDKLGNLAAFGASPGKIFTRVFVTVFLIVVIASVAVTFILPETYASTTTIKMEKSKSENDGQIVIYDPYYVQTQFEIINSYSVLNPVIERLHLNETWGKKYSAGDKLKNAESYEILKARLSIAPIRNTALANITFYSEDKLEAAQIANAIAESYQEYRIKNSGWNDHTPRPIIAEIVTPAEPGRSPVRPNITLNIVLGIFGGIFAAGIIGGVAFFVAKIRSRNRVPTALVGS